MTLIIICQIIKIVIMMGSHHHTLSRIHFLHTLVMIKFIMIYVEDQCDILSYIPLAPFKLNAYICIGVVDANI